MTYEYDDEYLRCWNDESVDEDGQVTFDFTKQGLISVRSDRAPINPIYLLEAFQLWHKWVANHPDFRD